MLRVWQWQQRTEVMGGTARVAAAAAHCIHPAATVPRPTPHAAPSRSLHSHPQRGAALTSPFVRIHSGTSDVRQSLLAASLSPGVRSPRAWFHCRAPFGSADSAGVSAAGPSRRGMKVKDLRELVADMSDVGSVPAPTMPLTGPLSRPGQWPVCSANQPLRAVPAPANIRTIACKSLQTNVGTLDQTEEQQVWWTRDREAMRAETKQSDAEAPAAAATSATPSQLSRAPLSPPQSPWHLYCSTLFSRAMSLHFTPGDYAQRDRRMRVYFLQPIWEAMRRHQPKGSRKKDPVAVAQRAAHARDTVLDACRAELRTLGLDALLHKLERGVQQQERYDFIMRHCGGYDILRPFLPTKEKQAVRPFETLVAEAAYGHVVDAEAEQSKKRDHLQPGERRASLIAAIAAATSGRSGSGSGSGPVPVTEADLKWALLFHKEAYVLINSSDSSPSSLSAADESEQRQQQDDEEEEEDGEQSQESDGRTLPQMGLFYKTGRVVPNPWMFWTLSDWNALVEAENRAMAALVALDPGVDAEASAHGALPPVPPATAAGVGGQGNEGAPFDLRAHVVWQRVFDIIKHRSGPAFSSPPVAAPVHALGSKQLSPRELRTLMHMPLLFLNAEPVLQQMQRFRLVQLRWQKDELAKQLRAEQERGLLFTINPPPPHAVAAAESESASDARSEAAAYLSERDAARTALSTFLPHTPYRLDQLFRLLSREELRLSMAASVYFAYLDLESRRFQATMPQRIAMQQAQEKAAAEREATEAQKRLDGIARAREEKHRALQQEQAARLARRAARVIERSGAAPARTAAHPDTASGTTQASESAQTDAALNEPVTVDVVATSSSSEAIDPLASSDASNDHATTAASPADDSPAVSSSSSLDAPAVVARRPVSLEQPAAPLSPDMPAIFSLYVSGRFLPPYISTATSSSAAILEQSTLRAGQPKLLRESLVRKLYDLFSHTLWRVQVAEEAIREFVRQSKLDGSWERMLQEKKEQMRAQGQESTEAVPVAPPSQATDSSSVPWRGDYPPLSSLAHSPLDCFLSYRTRSPTPRTLFDLVARPLDAQMGRATSPTAMRKRGDDIVAQWEAEVYNQAAETEQATTTKQEPAPESEPVSEPATESDPAAAAPHASSESAPVSGLWVAKVLVARARELPSYSLISTSAPSPDADLAAHGAEVLELEKRLFFEHHTLRLNPAMHRLLQSALDAPEEDGSVSDGGEEGLHSAAWEHLTRPSPFRAGTLPLPLCLAQMLLPSKLAHTRALPGGRSLRFHPTLVWELWKGLLDSVYLRSAPRAFAGYRRTAQELGLDPEHARLLRGHRVASRDIQGAEANHDAEADAADCDAVATRARACGIHVPRLVHGDLVWVDEPSFPSGDERAVAAQFDALCAAAARAEEEARVPYSNDLGAGGAGGANGGSVDAAAEAFHETARHRALRARMSRIHNRRLEQIRSGVVLRGLPPVVAGQSAEQRVALEIEKYNARCAKAEEEFQRRMKEVAQRKQQEEWRRQRAVVPFVRSAVEAQAAALAASTALSSSSGGTATGRRPRLGLKHLYDLLQACLAVPELTHELSAQKTAYPHQADSLLRMEHLRARLAALRVPRHNVHVLTMLYTQTASATQAHSSAPSPAAQQSNAHPAPLAPPRVVIVLTDLSLDDMRLIKSCLLHVAVARGLAHADAPPVLHAADPFTPAIAHTHAAHSSSSRSSYHRRGVGLDLVDEDDAWMIVQLGDVQVHAFTGAEQFSALEALRKQYDVEVSAGPTIQHADIVRAASAAHAAASAAAASAATPSSPPPATSDEPHAQRLPSVQITRFQVLLKASSAHDEHVAFEAPPL